MKVNFRVFLEMQSGLETHLGDIFYFRLRHLF